MYAGIAKSMVRKQLPAMMPPTSKKEVMSQKALESIVFRLPTFSIHNFT